MSEHAYASLAPHVTTLAAVAREFGSTASSSQLKQVFGPNWEQLFLQDQSPGQSCVYYLDGNDAASKAFQLCFNSARSLVEKSIIDKPSG